MPHGLGKRALALVAGAGAAAFAIGTHSLVGHADSAYECSSQPQNTVLLVSHTDGTIMFFHQGPPGDNPLQDAINAAKGSANVGTSSGSTSTNGSGAGDTVIACHGTYVGDLTIPAAAAGSENTNGDKDNITVRSEDGPSGVIIKGTGASGDSAIVNIDASGVTFGGPAEGFTIEGKLPTNINSNSVAVQLGLPGAQSTTNEDESCGTTVVSVPTNLPPPAPSSINITVPNGSGCDTPTPAGIPINDQVVDNVFTGLTTSGSNITGVELDNTINSTIQQNLFSNVASATVGTFDGITVGTLNGTSTAAGNGGTNCQTTTSAFCNGDSTNINTLVYQNAFNNVLTGACTSATGLQLNGFLLDAQVVANLIQQLAGHSTTCTLTGISSNAYGSLENEQTGTLVPINANIVNNVIHQLGQGSAGTAIYLAPNPNNAKPNGSSGQPSGCTANTMPSCNDNVPPSAYTVTDNELQQVFKAVDVEAVLGSNSYVRENNFDNDIIGVQNGSAVSQDTNLDATNDWWGCELNSTTVGGAPAGSPPPSTYGPGTNNHGCAALVSPAGDTSWAPTQSGRVEQAGSGAGANAGQN